MTIIFFLDSCCMNFTGPMQESFVLVCDSRVCSINFGYFEENGLTLVILTVICYIKIDVGCSDVSHH